MNFEYYKNSCPCPNSPIKPSPPRPETPDALRAYADDLEQWEKQDEEWREEASAWHKKSGELDQEFRHDALLELGLQDHPKADVLFQLAHARCQHEGHCAVFHEMQDLARLLRD